LQSIGNSQAFGTRSKQVATTSPKRQEAILDLLLGLDPAIAEDMFDVDPALFGKVPGYEQEAMAFQGVVLSAHDHRPTPLRDLQHLNYARLEYW